MLPLFRRSLGRGLGWSLGRGPGLPRRVPMDALGRSG